MFINFSKKLKSLFLHLFVPYIWTCMFESKRQNVPLQLSTFLSGRFKNSLSSHHTQDVQL